jgi:aminomethyltransferase
MSTADPSVHASETQAAPLFRTPLYDLHRDLGAKLVPFAGYEMPLQYGAGIVREHNHVRASAGLFDVSHMGQAKLNGPSFEAIASALETLVPADILGLKQGRLRYTQLLNNDGGIIDDLMVTRTGDTLALVVNASRKAYDFEHIAAHLPNDVGIVPEPERALLALQGPRAEAVLSRLVPASKALGFMESGDFEVRQIRTTISRCGYTGEDGFEISVAAENAELLAREILAQPEVLPIGLGARDTLRLEAGLCLYGQDMDEATSPVEANLSFSIGKRRREQGGFPGAGRVLAELKSAPARLRIGLKLEGRAAARSHTLIMDEKGAAVGEVTSGAFTPTAAASIATGYVPPPLSKPGTLLAADIRGASVPARVVALPFVPHRYARSV